MMKSTVQMLLRAVRRAFSVRAGQGTWLSPYEFVAFDTTPSLEATGNATDATVNAGSYVRELGGAQPESDHELEEFLATDRGRAAGKTDSERAA
jgi:hypothetical protein